MWSSCATDFDQEEETANFGTRLAVEANGCLYDVVTFATFQPSGGVVTNPTCVSACSTDQVLALALDSHLHIIETNRTSASFTIKFAADIDVLTWSPCEQFVIGGLRSGKIQILHLATKRPLPAMDCHQAEQGLPKYYIGCSLLSNSDLNFFTSTGKVQTLSNMRFDLLHEAIKNSNIGQLKTIQSNIIMNLRDGLHDNDCMRASIKCINDSEIFATDSFLATFDSEFGISNKMIFDFLPQGSSPWLLRSPKCTKNGIFFCLDTSGSVHVVCMETLLIVDVFSEENVLDMQLMEDEGDGNKFKVLMVVQGDEDGNYFQLRDYPSFDKVYEIKVNQYCQILDCCPSQENPMYLEGTVQHEGDSGKVISYVRMRGVCESVLEAKLQRMIRRQKFEEALKFARSFKFSLEPIYQAKTTFLMEELSPWRKVPLSEENELSLYQELKDTLKNLRDLDFMVNCCTCAVLPKFDQIRELLSFASETIQNNIEQDMNSQLLAKVSKTLQRLKTFAMIQPDGHVEMWIEFSRSNMLEECKKYLRQGNMEGLVIIWNRHKPDFTHELQDEDVIGEVLELIPDAWDINKKIKWLNEFLPFSLDIQPASISLIANWAEQKARKFEFSQRKQWPKNGLEFAQGVLKSLHFSSVESVTDFKSSNIELILHQQSNETGSELNNFIKLIDTLNDLDVLHSEYKIKIKLADFMLEDKSEVVEIILDWCTNEKDLQFLVQGFLKKYMVDFNLDMTTVFFNYVEYLIEQSESSWHWCMGNAPWEFKAKVLVPIMSSNEKKIDLILDILRAAPVPWSETINSICRIGESLSHPKANLVKEQEEMVGLKRVMRKYEFSDVSASGRSLERFYQRMISLKNEEGYMDALTVAKISPAGAEYDVIQVYVKHLLFVRDDSSIALNILRNLTRKDPRQASRLYRSVIAHAEIFLKTREISPCDSVLGFLNASVREVDISKAWQDKVELYKRRTCILNEFGKEEFAATFPIIEGQRLLKEFISRQVKEKDFEKEDELSNLYRKTTRLATLCEVSIEIAVSEILQGMANCGRFLMAKKLVGCLDHRDKVCSTEVVSRRLNLFNSVLQLKENKDNLKTLLEILEHSDLTTVCDAGSIRACINLSRWQKFLARICKFFHHDLVSMVGSESDAYYNWKFDSNFQDHGLPLDYDIVFPLLSCMEIALSSEMSSIAADDFIELGKELASSLCNLGHTELCLSVGSMTAETIAFKSSSSKSSKVIRQYIRPSEAIKDLFLKILGHKTPDYNFALSHLWEQSDKTAFQTFHSNQTAIGSDYTKLINLTVLQSKYFHARDFRDGMESSRNKLQLACWGKKVSKFNISFHGALSRDRMELLNVMKALATKSNMSVTNLILYCQSFSIDITSTMLLYCNSRILGLSPIISEDEKKIVMPQNFSETLKGVKVALSHVEDLEVKRNFFREIVDLINPYYYEVLEFLLEEMAKFDELYEYSTKAQKVLNFFSGLKRVAEPTPKEVEIWQATRTSNLPKISALRLPIPCFVSRKYSSKEKCKMIVKELTIDNFRQWCEIGNVMKINENYVCVHAVQNLIEDLKKENVDYAVDQDWNLSRAHTSLLEKVQPCIMAISDPQMATSCGHWFVKHLPGGIDKIDAAKLCLDMTLKWHQRDHSKESHQAYNMVESQLLLMETKNVMHKYNVWQSFADKNMEDLPLLELVETLYTHESVKLRNIKAGGRYPDINSAVNEIVEIHGEDLHKIKITFLERWLPPSLDFSNNDLNNTVSSFNPQCEPVSKEKDELNLMRCTYMSQDPSPEIINYLLYVGCSNSSKSNLSHQLRALKCLVSVAGDDILSSFVTVTKTEIKEHMQTLHFVDRLEKLNLPYTPEKFGKVDKMSLIESILRSNSHRLEGVSVIVDLCVQYDVFEAKLWMSLLKQMMKLSMVKTLEQSLTELNNHPHLWHFVQFHDAWKFLILSPFSEASIPVTPEQRSECEKSFERLTRCPIDFDINLLWGECKRVKLPRPT